MDSVTIGLDIGSSAVRAAEVHVSKEGRRSLHRYAQVGLPHGYVVDGEIVNSLGVSEALRRLWAEGGFSGNEVVLGVSGPRVFVRQADVPALNADDLRSSLRFDAQELVPIAMEDACFDFSILGPAEPASPGEAATGQRILLVAAHRDLLGSYITTLKGAGLHATVMDAAPLALVRAVPPVLDETGSCGVEVIVSLGAELTTVAVRENGIPRFIRSLTVGGSRLTESIANSLHLEMAVAERLKRGAVPADTPQLKAARKAMVQDRRDLAEEVRATIDFFVTQSKGTTVDRLLITGGAAQTEGLAMAIAGTSSAPVMAIDPLALLDTSALSYTPEELRRVGAGATTAIGLALWPTDAPMIRMSVLPEEILVARRARRLMTLAGGSLLGLLGLLGFVGVGQILAVHNEQHKVHDAQLQQATLAARVSHLQIETAVHGQAVARETLVGNALKGDVDWARVLGQLAYAMPPGLEIGSFTAQRSTTTTSSSGSAPSTTGAGSAVGTVTMSVKGNGGLPAVAAWVNGLSADGDLSQVWVTGIGVKRNGGEVNFSSTAMLTPESYSNRYKEVGK